jgi:hypothetical protein
MKLSLVANISAAAVRRRRSSVLPALACSPPISARHHRDGAHLGQPSGDVADVITFQM